MYSLLDLYTRLCWAGKGVVVTEGDSDEEDCGDCEGDGG